MTTQHDTNDPVRSIADTRAEMSVTLGAIEERLSPSHLREQVMEQVDQARTTLRTQLEQDLGQLKGTVKASVKEEMLEIKQGVRDEISDVKQILKVELSEAKAAVRAATIGKVETMMKTASDAVTETRSTILTTIRENPIPTAMIGLGMLWLLMNGTSSGRNVSRKVGELASSVGHRAEKIAEDAIHGAGIRVRDVTHQAAEGATSFATDASKKVGDVAHRAADAASDLATTSREGAVAVEQRFERTMNDNPLAVAAAAFALGTAIGLALPSTNREDSIMGELRDGVVDKAQHLAHDAVESAQSKLSGALDGHNGKGAPRRPNGAAAAPVA